MPAAREPSIPGQESAQSARASVEGRKPKMARVRGKSSLLSQVIVPNVGQYFGLCNCLLQYCR